jgi:plasmid stabilization system protein ParE
MRYSTTSLAKAMPIPQQNSSRSLPVTWSAAATGHGGVPRNTIRPGLRLAVHGRYNIYFQIVEDQTIIVRVLHSKRDIRRMGFNEEG